MNPEQIKQVEKLVDRVTFSEDKLAEEAEMVYNFRMNIQGIQELLWQICRKQVRKALSDPDLALLVTELPLISRERAEQTVGFTDCSGRKYDRVEREDIIRYVIEGAEIQRDKDRDSIIPLSSALKDSLKEVSK